ncbi:hypothetical protein AwWohl_12820 [Gammaproteobacteria bacterium]|nr:hypothetical protein AwWohl_12820 [Gammaproteobacteria bacterium]
MDKFIANLNAQLQLKNVELSISNEVKLRLASLGFDAKMGARAMARTIALHLKKPLAEALLFGELAHGGKVIFKLDNEQIIPTYLSHKNTLKKTNKKSAKNELTL